MDDAASWPFWVPVVGFLVPPLLAGATAAYLYWDQRAAHRGRTPESDRWELLNRLGYVGVEDSVWRRKQPGARRERKWTKAMPHGVVTLVELASHGFRFIVRLERYDPVTLQLDERDGPTRATLDHPFETGHRALDERFVASADDPQRARPLLTDPELVQHVLAVPFLWLHIHGDELVLQDRDGAGAKRLLGSARAPSVDRLLQAETEVLLRFETLITVFVGRLREPGDPPPRKPRP